MKANTPLELLGLAVSSSMRWLGLTSQIETPSRRYVRKLRTRHMKSTSGSTVYKQSKILDPDWKRFEYTPAAKTDLSVSMKRYKEMVKRELKGTIHSESQEGHSGGGDGQISRQQVNRLQNPQLSVVAKKG